MIERKCINCDLARHIALANLKNGFVCCGHFTLNREDTEINSLQEVWEGWAWLRRRPYTLNADYLGAGRMTNHSVIVKQDDYCQHFIQADKSVIQKIIERKKLAEAKEENDAK